MMMKYGIYALRKGTHALPLQNSLRFVNQATKKAPSVLVPIANGTEELEAVTVIDILVRSGAEVTVATVSPTGHNSLQVACSRGVKLVGDKLIDDCTTHNWDMVVLPGGMPGAVNLKSSSALTKILHSQVSAGRYIAAICASPAVILAQHGILQNKRATCYPAPHFKQLIGNYVDASVIVDNNMVTSQGPGTALPFALKLVEILFGRETVDRVNKELIYTHNS